MSKHFNINTRRQELDLLPNEEFDLIVIGGGITGAGIALDAVSRGWRVALFEKDDFASGTSSKSTKLIHGGLRYLKQLEFGLVRETGLERAIVHKLAPHLVHPETMFLPIVKKGSFSKFSASMAISVYDMLAQVRYEDRKQVLGKRDALAAEPLLDKKITKSAIKYSEYRTDDARLTFEVIKKAFGLGAKVFNYTKVQELLYSNGRTCGVRILDKVSGDSIDVRSKFVVSAAGPWVDNIRNKDGSLQGKQLRPTKGIHLVFPHNKLPVKQSVYFDDFKGRMLFAIPRLGVTYVGTTDTDYKGNLDKIVCTQNDVDYVLDVVNNFFNGISLKREDVISSWAGLRPLIAEKGKSATEVSRKDEVFISKSGLISIAGGKLTGYRKMAKRVVDLIQDYDKTLSQQECQTDELLLSDKGFSSYTDVKRYIATLEDELQKYSMPTYRVDYLVSNYGRVASSIVDHAKGLMNNEDDFDTALLKAELVHCMQNEMCWLPEDFYNRRTGMLYFDPQRLDKNLDLILQAVSDYHQWSEDEVNKYAERSRADLKRHFFPWQ